MVRYQSLYSSSGVSVARVSSRSRILSADSLLSVGKPSVALISRHSQSTCVAV